jgi:hypothetical protein
VLQKICSTAMPETESLMHQLASVQSAAKDP